MRIENDKPKAQSEGANTKNNIKDIISAHPAGRPKFNISMEKKIEQLWLSSREQGWRFSDFVAAVMEVLTVLYKRHKLRGTAIAPPARPANRA